MKKNIKKLLVVGLTIITIVITAGCVFAATVDTTKETVNVVDVVDVYIYDNITEEHKVVINDQEKISSGLAQFKLHKNTNYEVTIYSLDGMIEYYNNVIQIEEQDCAFQLDVLPPQ